MAKKNKKEPLQTPPKKEDTRTMPTTHEIEQKKMKLISNAVLPGDTAHWVSETYPDTPQAEIIIIESPSTTTQLVGNALILAKPSTYPYQARWYPNFRIEMTKKGWNLTSIGIPAHPQLSHPKRSDLATLKDIEQHAIHHTLQQNFIQDMTAWENKAVMRGQLLITHSSNNNAEQSLLIGVGLSAHIAGLIATDSNTQLTGLVLINLESPSTQLAQTLSEKLSKQGPILEIITSNKTKIIHNAKIRQRLAARAKNKDYRLIIAPSGFQFDAASQTWITTTIHGWATRKK